MNTKKLRQKILDLAIRGKLVPQDPNDEPASVLLDRIRAEKERLIKEGKIKRSKKTATDDEIEAPFEIPESWEWTTIGEIASSILYGVSESAKEKGNYKLLRITDIQNNKVNWDSVPYTDFDVTKAQSYLLQDGDILFARTGATVGKSYLVEGILQPSIYASYLIRVQTSSVILPSYIKYFFESGYYWNQITLSSVGIGQPNVNGTTLAGLSIPIPPCQEQKRIAYEVERWFAVIDELESNEGDLLKAIDQAKSKILDLAIHGKLVPQDPNDEPAIDLLKRINPKFEPCGRVGHIPDNWTYCRIQDVFKITMGSSPVGESLNRNGDGIEFHQGKLSFTELYLGVSNVYTTQSIKLASPNSLLLCVRAPVGVVNITEREVCIGRGLCSLTPLNTINLMYGFYVLQTCQIEFEQKATGSTFKAIGGDVVKNQIIPIPPYKEQLRIVAKIEELFGVLDSIKASLE